METPLGGVNVTALGTFGHRWGWEDSLTLRIEEWAQTFVANRFSSRVNT